ncbi:MAG: type II toxin-antitoxin system VapC family toxin [Gammaproteobacteria bacterium]|nr:type II toxin-antitoxin system VapC family toxin [Gammaproteobacteria bacterium]
MRTRVYLDTSIPSFYHTLRKDSKSVARMHWTREWWSEYSKKFKFLTSPAVIAELQRGASEKTVERISLLDGIELLEITNEVEQITNIYIEKLVMPNDPAGDALHLALASFHKVDVLLTWNCQNLANPNKMEHIRLINYELSLSIPLLTTPLNYLSGGESDG